MPRLTFTSALQDRLTSLGQTALEHDNLDEFRKYIATELETLFDASGSAFFHWGKFDADPGLLDEGDLVFPVHWDNFRKKQYLEEVYKSDPIIKWLHAGSYSKTKGVVRVTDLVQPGNYVNSPLYQEFLRPLHSHYILTLAFSIRNNLIGNISLLRPDDANDFSQEEEETARLVIPILSAAYSKLMLSEELLLKDSIIYNLENYHSENALFILARDLSCISKSIGADFLLESLRSYGVSSIANLLFRSNSLMDCINKCIANNEPFLVEQFDNVALHPELSMSLYLTTLSGNAKNPYFFLTVKSNAINLSVERAASKYNLTRREHQILNLIRQGHSNAEIGGMLTISQWTVKNHVQAIYRKAGVKNRTALTNNVLQGI